MGATARADPPRGRSRGQAKGLGARLPDSAPPRAPKRRPDASRAAVLPTCRPPAAEPSVRRVAAADPRGRLRLHPAAQRREEASAHIGAGRQLPPYEAGQGLLQGEVHGVAGPRAGADPRPPQERPGLRAAGLPAHDLAERRAAKAERRTVGGAGGPQRQEGWATPQRTT